MSHTEPQALPTNPQSLAATTKATTLFQKVVAQKTKLKTIDPMFISLLLDLAKQLLATCFKTNSAEGVKDLAEKHPIIAGMRIRQGMRRAGYQNHPDAENIVGYMLDAAKDADANDLMTFTHEE